MTDAFGKTLRLLRETHNFGLREAARKLQISPSYLSRLETYDEPNPPSERVISGMAKLYGAKHDDLMELAGRVPRAVIEFMEDNYYLVKEIQGKISEWMKTEMS
ncbi:MAG: helix-turn-helix transcriptional regulator [Patescibacteria group bacterium]